MPPRRLLELSCGSVSPPLVPVKKLYPALASGYLHLCSCTSEADKYGSAYLTRGSPNRLGSVIIAEIAHASG